MLYAYQEDDKGAMRGDLYTLYDTETGVYQYYEKQVIDVFARNGARIRFSEPAEKCDLTGQPVVQKFTQALLEYEEGTPPAPDHEFLEYILERNEESRGDLGRKHIEGILYLGDKGQIAYYVRKIIQDNMMWDWYTVTTGLCICVKTDRFCGNFRYEIEKNQIKNVEIYQDEGELNWDNSYT